MNTDKHADAAVQELSAIIDFVKFHEKVIGVDDCFLDEFQILGISMAEHIQFQCRATLTFKICDGAQREQRPGIALLIL